VVAKYIYRYMGTDENAWLVRWLNALREPITVLTLYDGAVGGRVYEITAFNISVDMQATLVGNITARSITS